MDPFILSIVCYWLAVSLGLVVLVALARMAAGHIQDVDRIFCGVLAGMFVLAVLFVAAGYVVSTDGLLLAHMTTTPQPSPLEYARR